MTKPIKPGANREAGKTYRGGSGPLVRRFSPYDFDDEQVLRQSTRREALLARIIRVIKENLEQHDPPNQHLLVLGNRGMGKSFLVRRVQIEVERLAREGAPLVFVRLPEEQLNVSAPELLLDEIRRILTQDTADAVRVKWRSGEEKEWYDSLAKLQTTLSEQPGFSASSGLLVVSIENFDILLEDIFQDDAAQSRLRTLLSEEPRLMFLATSTIEADSEPQKRLFQAFKREQLPAWGPDEFVEFYRKTFTGEITTGLESKIRALAHFMGGSPRLAVLIGDVLHSNDALSAVQTLDQLADELTPYFQDRIMNRLKPKSRWLLDDLLRGGEPCSQVELANRVGAAGQSDISQPFAALLREGVVVDRRYKGKRGKYAVTDRVFAHYYRKRYLAGESHSPLSHLVEFLENFYNQRERAEQLVKLVEEGRIDEARLFAETIRHGVGVWGEADEGVRIREARRLIRLTCQCMESEAEGDFWKVFLAIADKIGPKQATIAMRDVQDLARRSKNPIEKIAADMALGAVFLTLPNDEMAMECFAKALADSREIEHEVLSQLSLFLVGFTENIANKGADAKKHFSELMNQIGGIVCDNLYIELVNTKMLNQITLEEWDEAETTFQKAIADPKINQNRAALVDIYDNIVYLRYKQNNYQASLDANEEALRLCRQTKDDERLSIMASDQSILLSMSGQYDEALSAARAARVAGKRASDDFLVLRAIQLELDCLNNTSEHQTVIEGAPAMAELAQKLEEPIGEANAHRLLADAWQAFNQTDKTLSARRAAVEASLHSRYRLLVSIVHTQLFKSLQVVEGDVNQEIVNRFLVWAEYWAGLNEAQNVENLFAGPAIHFDILAKAATLSDRWLDIIYFMEYFQNVSRSVPFPSTAVGDALIALYDAEGPGPTFSAMAGFLRALREPLGRATTDGELIRFLRKLFDTTCSRLVAKLTNPDLLRDMAGDVREQLNGDENAKMLEAAALYREHSDDPAVLDGVDPDIAETVRTVLGIAGSDREPDAPEAKATRRRKEKK